MTADTPKFARSTRSQDLLCRLVREIDYAEAYRLIRALKHGGDGELPSLDSVILWVLDLMRLRNALIAGDSDEDIREIIEKCGQPIAEDDSPLDESNEVLEYLEHSAELQAVWDILSGVPEADRKPGPYPLDVDRGRVAEKAATLVEGLNLMADRLGAERAEAEVALPPGWRRTDNQTGASWGRSWGAAPCDATVTVRRLFIDGESLTSRVLVAGEVSAQELLAILTIESNRGLS